MSKIDNIMNAGLPRMGSEGCNNEQCSHPQKRGCGHTDVHEVLTPEVKAVVEEAKSTAEEARRLMSHALKDMKQTKVSHVGGGVNEITATMNDGSERKFFIENGRDADIEAADKATEKANEAARKALQAQYAAEIAAGRANDAATTANAAAAEAERKAEAAKQTSETAAATANASADRANQAATSANTAASSANTAASNANTKATEAQSAANAANTAASSASSAAGRADQSATVATQAASAANTAAVNANAAAQEASQVNERVTELARKIDEVTDAVKPSLNDGTYYITDAVGNVIAKFDAEKGLTTTDVNLPINGELQSIVPFIQSIGNVSALYDKMLYITDGDGNVIAKFGEENGQIVADYVGKDKGGEGGDGKHWLTGKEVFFLGDSMFDTGNARQSILHFGEVVGCNTHNYSMGGTRTKDYADGQQARAKQIVEYKNNGGKVDVVIIENINDGNIYKTIGDGTEQPLFMTQKIDYPTAFATLSEMQSYFTNSLSSVLSGNTPMVGTYLVMHYLTGSKTATIKSRATKNGTITLYVGGTAYGIQVTTAMSIEQIVKAIVEWNFDGYEDRTKDTDKVIFQNNTGGEVAVTFEDTDNTGVRIDIGNLETTTADFGYIFASRDLADWSNNAKWMNTSNTAKTAAYIKGLIEYLQTNLPEARLVYMTMPRIKVNFTTPLASIHYADGSFNMAAFRELQGDAGYANWIALADVQKKICDEYNVIFADVAIASNLTPFNAYPKYAQNNNVHLTLDGFYRVQETLAQILTCK